MSNSLEETQRASIGERIKLALDGQNIVALAAKLSVAPGTVYDWRKGRFLPDVARLTLFAQLTGSDVCWLITGRRDDYLTPGDLNVFPAPLAFMPDWLNQIAVSAGAKVEELAMMAIVDDAMEPTLRRGQLALARWLPKADAGRNQFLSAPPDGIYALQVIARAGDREKPPLTRTIARRSRWGLGEETVTISCDNEAYARETRTLTISSKEAPLIVGPIVWQAGLL